MIVTADPQAAHDWTIVNSRIGRVAFVPTMGALHEGHLALVQRAKELADTVAVSIFVNPTQFAPTEDLARYPRPLDADLSALRAAGTGLVFTPGNEQIYPPGFSTFIEPPSVAQSLEGELRPGHFRGVCTVVLKLFNIIPAAVAVFGQKDFQQSLVVGALVRDLALPIEIEIAPTVREPDGLAMSSRNRYLTPEQRLVALCLSKALRAVQSSFAKGERRTDILNAVMQKELHAGEPGGVDRVDYAVVADRYNLEQSDLATNQSVALIAARVGTTRLIDNMLLHGD
jgi:pantoate--beta-alanine ligase